MLTAASRHLNDTVRFGFLEGSHSGVQRFQAGDINRRVSELPFLALSSI